MKLYDRYAPCKPQPPTSTYAEKRNPYRTYWKLDDEDRFADEYSEFENLLELIKNFDPSPPRPSPDVWLKGYFNESTSQPLPPEIDHPDILELLEESS